MFQQFCISRFSFVLAAIGGTVALSLLGPDTGERQSMATLPSKANIPQHQDPTAFIANRGQWDHPGQFVSSCGAMTVFLEDRGWVVNLAEPRRSEDSDPARAHAFRMQFEGGFATPRLVGEGQLSTHYNYFVGSDATRWQTGVPLFESVRYEGLYRGIDIRMRHAEGHPEYDLLLAPGADLSRVSVRVDGADAMRLASDGSLVIDTALGAVTQAPPLTWQTGAFGEREALPCRYVLLASDRFGFEVDGWDPDLHLTIDPGLVYLRFLGTPGNDVARAVHIDDNGFTTVTGYTDFPIFPTTLGAFDRTFNGGLDTFVSRLNPQLAPGPFRWGTQPTTPDVVWSTFLGGTGTDISNHLKVDDQGVVTVTGETMSADFPITANAFDTSHNGGRDVFVTRLDPAQTGAAQLVYSTFLGGSLSEVSWELDVDAAGVITVAGDVLSVDFPTTAGAFDTTSSGRDAFVARLDPSLVGSAQLIYSTYLGGDARLIGGFAFCLSVSGGVITVAGFTDASDFPTTAGAFDTTHGGGLDAFVSQLDPSQTGAAQLLYSTFLGALSDDVALDLSTEGGRITVAGWTQSAGFPTTAGAFGTTPAGLTDAYVTQLDPAQTGAAQLVYSTRLGGSGGDSATGVSVASNGWVTLTGRAGSNNFPTTLGAAAETFSGGLEDGFVCRLDPTKTGAAQLLYSTYLGGIESDRPAAIEINATGTVAVAGQTEIEDIADGLSWEGFVAHLDMLPRGVSPVGISSPGCTGPLNMSVTSMPQVGNTNWAVTCDNAPASSALGFFILSTGSLPAPLVLLGANIWVDLNPPVIVLNALSNGVGTSEVAVPIPANPAFGGASLAAQFIWAGPATPPSCPLLGFSSSNALDITIQP